MNYEQILEYVKADGWPVEPLSDSTFRTSFRGEQRTFSFFVHTEPQFLTIAAVPYARIPTDPALASRFMDRLLHLNTEMNLAKFSVDDDGDVVLSVEYPIADLDQSELRDALDVLTFYADKHWPELSGLLEG